MAVFTNQFKAPHHQSQMQNQGVKSPIEGIRYGHFLKKQFPVSLMPSSNNHPYHRVRSTQTSRLSSSASY